MCATAIVIHDETLTEQRKKTREREMEKKTDQLT